VTEIEQNWCKVMRKGRGIAVLELKKKEKRMVLQNTRQRELISYRDIFETGSSACIMDAL
jgi:hypothetical protein